MEKITTFQTRFKEIMEERNINQTKLSELTNIKRTSISGYYVGDAEPNADKALILALKLGVEPLWLMGYDVPKDSSMLNEITSILKGKNEEDLKKVKDFIVLLFDKN